MKSFGKKNLLLQAIFKFCTTKCLFKKTFEYIFTTIELLNNTVCYGNIYRSSLNNNYTIIQVYSLSKLYSNKIFQVNLDECFLNSKESLNKCIITGDFNYDLLNQENIHVSNFVEVMHENYFPVINQTLCFSTISRPIYNCSRSHLDQLYSHQIKSGVILDPISDHLPVYICIDFTKHDLYNPKQKRFFNQSVIFRK